MTKKIFQRDRFKYNSDNQLDIYNPEFESAIKSRTDEEIKKTNSLMDKFYYICGFFKFYPDILLDIMTPEESKYRLNLYQRVMLRILFRFKNNYIVISRGSAKCVTQDTLLFTSDGIKEIGSYNNYDDGANEYISYNYNISMLNRYGKIENSNAFVHNGLQDTNKILTSDGYKIECTNKHPLLTKSKFGRLTWKKSSELVVGDYLAISRNNDLWGNTVSAETKECLKQVELKNIDVFAKEIPKCIMEAPKEVVTKYIQGLFDISGEVEESNVNICITNEKMAYQIKMILLNLGMISHTNKNCNEKSKDYLYKIYIYGENIDLYNKLIGFSCNAKQSKLNLICKANMNLNKNSRPYRKNIIAKILTGWKSEFKDANYYFDRVVSIEKSQNIVCDVSMPHTQSFIGNGMVNHNTFTELLALMLKAIMYPGVRLSVTAESKEQASNILKDKFNELLEWFPFLQSEVLKFSFGKDTAYIKFVNGSVIDVIGAIQTSKGLRRHSGSIEESSRMSNFIFKDVIQPIFSVPRRTASGETDKRELHGALNFFTTSGFRGTEEFQRNLNMVDEMAECRGSFVFGASWELPVFFGLTTKKYVMDIKDDPTTSATSFSMNYESRWVGASTNALIGMDKIIELRDSNLKVELKQKDNADYAIAVDVARSKSDSNNQTSFIIGKIIRNKDKTVKRVEIVNIIVPPNGLSFTEQAVIAKRLQKAYNALAVCVDTNGLGKQICPLCQ